MNIYQHIEIAARELDSKLLLAVVAASRGHDVLISEMSTIMKGVQSAALAPGVFHTKSLTPCDKKIARHQTLVDGGFPITSIDEEGGLIDHGYDKFAEVRYSGETIDQASAVFGWGTEDTVTLKRVYPNYSSKIHQTGSPRADLWRPRFSQFWGFPREMPEKPFLLVSSNMGTANNVRPFHERIRFERRAGYYQRDPEMFSRKFVGIAEDYRMTLAFIEAIRHLAASNDGYDIVLRPHPVESVEAWNVYLEGIPNVHVIREGSITAWVNSAFAVMHNGCTTALEATVSGKPVVTYLPFEQEHARDIPNELGVCVESLEDLSDIVNQLFHASRSGGGAKSEEALPESVAKKVYLDGEELAAEKIVKVWESLDNGELSRPCNWTRFQAELKLAKLRGVVVASLRKALPSRFGPAKENYKFPPMDAADISERVKRLQHVLGIHGGLECKLLSERALLVKKSKN
ncbi:MULTISPECIES: surface carbohydrate biosynthesis protein [unclassified Halorhodospira]|uniref:surface carbohydrate biosynthesis protein n=1 Tax=unclassified Halorhodospira TaxID=2626748 RepID=UPI001EE955DD|nr:MULTISPECIES: surface carbohydrate biosynthesis protein [unclassified Halorhodospira]MCG5541847.1 hypothetical protein [Halorhodospira sp. M39old]MCG5546917.1 hypothetical protein [Halorhodospira sp. M38]